MTELDSKNQGSAQMISSDQESDDSKGSQYDESQHSYKPNSKAQPKRGKRRGGYQYRGVRADQKIIAEANANNLLIKDEEDLENLTNSKRKNKKNRKEDRPLKLTRGTLKKLRHGENKYEEGKYEEKDLSSLERSYSPSSNDCSKRASSKKELNKRNSKFVRDDSDVSVYSETAHHKKQYQQSIESPPKFIQTFSAKDHQDLQNACFDQNTEYLNEAYRLDVDNQKLSPYDILSEDVLQLYKEFYMFKEKAKGLDDEQLSVKISNEWQIIRQKKNEYQNQKYTWSNRDSSKIKNIEQDTSTNFQNLNSQISSNQAYQNALNGGEISACGQKNCSKSFPSLYLKEKHEYKVHFPNGYWLCDVCLKKHAHKCNLKTHMFSHHPEEYKTYDQSSKMINLPPVYSQDQPKPKKDKECYFCPKRSRSERSRVRHCKRRHEDENCTLDALDQEPYFEFYSHNQIQALEIPYIDSDYKSIQISQKPSYLYTNSKHEVSAIKILEQNQEKLIPEGNGAHKVFDQIYIKNLSSILSDIITQQRKVTYKSFQKYQVQQNQRLDQVKLINLSNQGVKI